MDWIPVEGRSMHPFLGEGDQLGVEWVSESYQPQKGEIVIYRDADGQWIAHRVIGNPLTLKGDSSFSREAIAPGSLWGKVVSLRKKHAGQAALLNPSRADRWIAALSSLSLHSNRFFRKFARVGLCTLAWIRRNSL